MRHRKPENWLEAVGERGHGIREERPLGPREQASEALLMGLRLAEGVDLEVLSRRFGIRADALIDPAKMALYEGLGLTSANGTRVGVTPRGMPVLDALLGELVPGDLVTA